jgi:putative heme-binding domain-containing protein
VRFVAVQWVGEAVLPGFREALRQVLERPDLSRSLFEATLAALERLDRAGGRGEAADEASGQDFIATVVADPTVPDRLRARALRRLRADHPLLDGERLGGWLSSSDPELRLEAVRSLREGGLADRGARLLGVAADARRDETLRAEAAVGLGGTTAEEREALVDLAAGGPLAVRREALRSLRGVQLDGGERRRLEDANGGDVALGALLATLDRPDRDPDAPAATDLGAWERRLEGSADAAAGERLFFHPKGPGCARCHAVDGRGGGAGPELSTAGSGLTGRRLLESVLRPSQEIAPQYTPWTLALEDGKVLSGVLLEETVDGRQVYADGEGRTFTVRAAEVVERRPQAVSIMPEGLERTMTLQEFRDLMAYLQRR